MLDTFTGIDEESEKGSDLRSYHGEDRALKIVPFGKIDGCIRWFPTQAVVLKKGLCQPRTHGFERLYKVYSSHGRLSG